MKVTPDDVEKHIAALEDWAKKREQNKQRSFALRRTILMLEDYRDLLMERRERIA